LNGSVRVRGSGRHAPGPAPPSPPLAPAGTGLRAQDAPNNGPAKRRAPPPRAPGPDPTCRTPLAATSAGEKPVPPGSREGRRAGQQRGGAWRLRRGRCSGAATRGCAGHAPGASPRPPAPPPAGTGRSAQATCDPTPLSALCDAALSPCVLPPALPCRTPLPAASAGGLPSAGQPGGRTRLGEAWRAGAAAARRVRHIQLKGKRQARAGLRAAVASACACRDGAQGSGCVEQRPS
jgi:hypothetical protein